MKKEELLYWFNKRWTFPDPSDDIWDKCSEAYKQIVALMKKEVTEEWIEKKAKDHVCDLLDLRPKITEIGDNEWVRKTKDFICSLVEEITSLQEVDKGDG